MTDRQTIYSAGQYTRDCVRYSPPADGSSTSMVWSFKFDQKYHIQGIMAFGEANDGSEWNENYSYKPECTTQDNSRFYASRIYLSNSDAPSDIQLCGTFGPEQVFEYNSQWEEPDAPISNYQYMTQLGGTKVCDYTLGAVDTVSLVTIPTDSSHYQVLCNMAIFTCSCEDTILYFSTAPDTSEAIPISVTGSTGEGGTHVITTEPLVAEGGC